MLSVCGWLLLDVLLVCLLYRGWRGHLFTRYRYFYTYVFGVLISDGIRYYYYFRRPGLYQLEWWISEFITVLLGFSVTWEIFTQMLRPYRGALRMGRFVLMVLFASILGKAAFDLAGTSLRALVPTTLELERNLRVFQALVLLCLIAVTVHYALPAGRNIRWMLAGYTSYLGAEIALFTAFAVRGDLLGKLAVLPTLQYCAMLIVWCFGMWSFAPNPMPGFSLEEGYERISGQTQRALGRLRAQMTQPWRT